PPATPYDNSKLEDGRYFVDNSGVVYLANANGTAGEGSPLGTVSELLGTGISATGTGTFTQTTTYTLEVEKKNSSGGWDTKAKVSGIPFGASAIDIRTNGTYDPATRAT
ncbi:hypothetical protein, partial [Acinetobacter baumannii]|uniref:hypothetical protein n=1 Tax=Acinetobacter baumannii TaxID=470 RepID=UPI000A927BAF